MKKSIIAAGASAVALAAMPVVGVFAQASNPTGFVDTLQLTIADSCTWTRTLANSDTTNYSITTGTGATAIVARAVATAGATYEGFATSTINAKCNNGTGYKITGTFTDLGGHVSSSNNASNNSSIAYGGDSELAAGTWIARLGEATVGLESGTAGNVADKSVADDMGAGSTYVITYDVQTATNQAAGYYEGTATYALSQNSLPSGT